MLLKNNGVLPLKGTERIRGHRPARGCDASAARQLFISAFRVRRYRWSMVCGVALPKATRDACALVRFDHRWRPDSNVPRLPLRRTASLACGPSTTTPMDACPSATRATRNMPSAQGKVKFRASRPSPGLSRASPCAATNTRSSRTTTAWCGRVSSCRRESGTYRIGSGGPNAELIAGQRGARAASPPAWGTRLEMTTLQLEKGGGIRFASLLDALLLAGVEVSVETHLDPTRSADLRAAAAQADVIVAAAGPEFRSRRRGDEGRAGGFSGGDKTSIDLPADQRRLLEQAKATGKPLIVVLMNGSTLDLSWAKEHASAIVEAWYAGQAGGLAIGNVIAGKTNPAGRLPLTFYRSVADLPPFDDYSMKGRTYRYFEGTPVYPFGYG